MPRSIYPVICSVIPVCAIVLIAPCDLAGAETPRQKQRLVLCDDGGTLAPPNQEAPVGVEGLIRAAIDPLRGTMIDTLYWQLGVDPYWSTPTHRLSDWYLHDTKIGSHWGEGMQKFNTAGEWRIYENARQIMEQGTDPPAVVIDAGHKAGLDVFLSFRFNDGHDSRMPGGLGNPYMAPRKREHPEWLIGEPDFHRLFAYDFAIPEVRSYRSSLIDEAIDRYDLDGLDLDFCRGPGLFKKGEGESNAHYITAMVREFRQRLDAKGDKSNRKLYLSVRVPWSMKKNREYGIAVDEWIATGLVDLVTVAELSGWNYRLPIEEFRAMAKGTQCRILAQNLCAYKENRPRSAAVLFGEKNYYSTAMFRAVAAKHWQAGADGIFLWNQHWIQFHADDSFDAQSWKEIGSPQALVQKDKHYLVGPKDRGGSLPIALPESGEPATLAVEIADDIAAARMDGSLSEATLRVLVEQLTSQDEVDFRINGVALDPKKAKQRLNYNDCWLDFDVASILRLGVNQLSLSVKSRNPRVSLPLNLRSVEAIVRFQGGA